MAFDYLLNEDGSRLLQEDSSLIILDGTTTSTSSSTSSTSTSSTSISTSSTSTSTTTLLGMDVRTKPRIGTRKALVRIDSLR